MPQKADALSDAMVRTTKPGKTVIWKTDRLSKGLQIVIHPDGRKRWVGRYSWGGKRTFLALGAWPGVDLAAARKRNHNEILVPLAAGLNPKEERKRLAARKANGTFSLVAGNWLSSKCPGYTPNTIRTVRSILDKFVIPFIGSIPLDNITSEKVVEILTKMKAVGSFNQAARCRGVINKVFRFGKSLGLVDAILDIPTVAIPKVKNMTALTEPRDLSRLGEILRLIEVYQGSFPTKTALWCVPRLFVRPSELCSMKWADVDLARKEWRYRASKKGIEMVVPLADSVVAKLEKLQPLTGKGRFVFSNVTERPLTTWALLAALRTLGVGPEEQTIHGFRATARTFLVETLDFRPEWVEMQLGHAVKDPNGTAYNRTQWLIQRRGMMQRWAEFLDELRARV